MKLRSSIFAMLFLMSASHAETIAIAIAITGATVHTMGPAGTLLNATVIIRDGHFDAIGTDIAVPPDATVIDGRGKIITPGFFSPMGQIGLTEVSAVQESVDYYQRGDEYTASFDITDAYNSRSILIPINRAGGITRTLSAPVSYYDDLTAGHVFSGIAFIAQLGDTPAFVTDRKAAMVVNLGLEGSNVAGGSRALAIMSLRGALDDAADYRQNKAAYDRGQRREYSLGMADLEALQDVLAGKTPLLVNVNRASDIEALLRIRDEYQLRLIVYGGSEAWMLAEQLAAANVAVILDSKGNLPSSFDRINARLESPAILAAAGVEISFAGDTQSETFSARNISQSAGNAVANGLAWIDALEAITIAPARMYGVDDHIGSIEAGKEADLIVWPADPLELTSNPEKVMIRGAFVSLENRQTLLRDRYVQTKSAVPPGYRH